MYGRIPGYLFLWLKNIVNICNFHPAQIDIYVTVFFDVDTITWDKLPGLFFPKVSIHTTCTTIIHTTTIVGTFFVVKKIDLQGETC